MSQNGQLRQGEATKNDADGLPHGSAAKWLKLNSAGGREGLDQPAGPLETQTITAIERQIQALGMKVGTRLDTFVKHKSNEEIHLAKPRRSPHGSQSIPTDGLEMRDVRKDSGNCAAD